MRALAMPKTLFEQLLPLNLRIASFAVARMAASKGIAADTRRDLVQEALLELWRKAPLFDPRRSSWPTFSDRVIVNRLRSLMRNRRPMHHEFCRERPHNEVTDAFGEAELCIELRVDVARILSGVSRFDRSVAASLAERSVTETSDYLGISRARIYRAIDRLRTAFTTAGFFPSPHEGHGRRRATHGEIQSEYLA
jgi:RNA polymerase sigma factor (sigma-70 family)